MDLIQKYRQMAEKGVQLWGLSILQHQREIHGLIEQTNSRTVLDFGCGRADAYRPPHEIHRTWGIEMPALYDPAFSTHDVLPPGTFDAVLCSDVLEHVQVGDVQSTIRLLFDKAERAVWASVCCRPAKKTFDDGTNLHVTVRPYTWWRKHFSAAANDVASRRGVQITWKLTETP